ncbi:MAG: DNA translocase FtsK [Verrucomicrobiota bacterium]
MASPKKKATRKRAASKSKKAEPKQSITVSLFSIFAYREVMALIFGGIAIMLLLAMVSYSPRDLPNWVPCSSHSGSEEFNGNFIGPVGAIVAFYLFFFLGVAAFMIPAILLWWVYQIVAGTKPFNLRNIVGASFLIGSAACLIEFQNFWFSDWIAKSNIPYGPGGGVGHFLGYRVLESTVFGAVGSFIVCLIIYLVALIVITGIHPFHFIVLLRNRLYEIWVNEEWRRWIPRMPQFAFDTGLPEPAKRSYQKEAPKPRATRKPKPAPVEEEEVVEPVVAEEPAEEPAPEVPAPERKIIDASQPKKSKAEAISQLFPEKKKENPSLISSAAQYQDYELPSLEILSYGDVEDEDDGTDEAELIALQNTIVNTLDSFGVKVRPGDITKGPTITRYEVFPSAGLRVNRISALEADLACATKAERINILAPIPGKDTVGIEIANSNKITVALRELFEDDAFRKTKAKLPLALGKDVYGKTVVADLAKMPHLLVAGATGSGKSVCINGIIASLLYRFTPDELKFIMIDPKVVEMQLYNDLPHMVVPVVTDPKKVLLALRWVINEMERRYEMFAKKGTRNFEGFNTLRAKEVAEEKAAKEEAAAAAEAGDVIVTPEEEDEDAIPPFSDDDPLGLNDPIDPMEEQPELFAVPEEDFPESLPYIVVIIDELADLMQTAPADVETGIARIAQKARAAGIHLIVATQTPRADVVTGIIKANVPSRIAFQVSSKMDSRIILDENGAENLVGKGDMLYLPPGTAKLMRAQGALITDEEAQELVDACADQATPQFELDSSGQSVEFTAFEESEEEELSDADEETVQKCLEVIYTEKKASTSLLQRRLRLGYTRAARMMDILEARGIIGPGDGAKPREILIDVSDDQV